jgi:regulator-associated protein of mTOR
MDIRVMSDGDGALNSGGAGGAGSPHEQLSCAVVRQVEAHSKGGMSVMVAHPNAPLLATGSTSQVVKVWTDAGDVVS